MNPFVQRHQDDVIGMLNGFDRVRIRGTIRWLASLRGLGSFLASTGVLLKDFKDYAQSLTGRVRKAITEMAERLERPNQYLYSSSRRKELIAREIARRDGVQEGLVCVLRCVEPCFTFRTRRNPEIKQLELVGFPGKCEHYYSYFLHPRLGFMHVRVQTWFPFTIHACLNGREWLARQMDAAGIGYRRRENCFMDVQDFDRAQQLLDQQVRLDWPRLLDDLLALAHPAHQQLFGPQPLRYYWSIDESEWATDILFRSPSALAALYPRLLHQGMTTLSSPDVLRFLGHKLPAHGGVNGHFTGEVVSDLKHRPEGVRIKHQVNRNSIKMYDKQGSVLRVETTINDARDIKTYRAKEGDPNGPKAWRKMRKGVGDVARRARVSQAANERYLEALAGGEGGPSLGELTDRLCRPRRWHGDRVRGLNPLAPADARLLAAVHRGEFSITGLRNRDLRTLLFGADPTDETERRRRSAAVSRKLRLLRAHGLIRKVPRSHRYLLTRKGRQIITALLLAQHADAEKLAHAA
ncbi:MAG TPA: hypothetical protein VM243_10645 [Phycisphaerae bacterium]|nr:hypothetical protein [Phycisphaerae bacterium]